MTPITDARKTADSLQKRYVYKLSANLLGLLVGLATQAIIPRGLGPKAYGDFGFISNFFTQVVNFLDMGTSMGFYTKLSQRPNESSLVSFYFLFSVFVSVVLAGFVAVAVLSGAYNRLWPGQELKYVYLGTVWGILFWITLVLIKMADAYGLTVSAEIARMVQKFTGLAIILVLFVMHRLNLTSFFYYQYLLYIILGLAFVWVITRSGYPFHKGWPLSGEQALRYIKEFYLYSHPLFSYALVSMIVGILTTWFLQKYAGSVQQGFYSLSYQIGAVCFLFTGAMTPLLTREFSLAFSSGDLTKMAMLFRRYIPLLYATAAYVSCFVVIQADKVVYLMGGHSFNGAVLPVIIMAFYPIHQTYGQLSGSVFFATGRTIQYRNIGITLQTLSLPVTYFLVAPRQNMGLDAGAVGLALSMVAFQFIGVNVQLFYNTRLLKLSFVRYLGHQVISVASLLMVAAFASIIVGRLPVLHEKAVLSFIGAGVLYTLLVAGLVYFLPVIFGLRREDIQSASKYLQDKLSSAV